MVNGEGGGQVYKNVKKKIKLLLFPNLQLPISLIDKKIYLNKEFKLCFDDKWGENKFELFICLHLHYQFRFLHHKIF